MKNTYRLKNYLKLGILLFGISFAPFNCAKEEVNLIENISTVKPSLTINRINESEFISNKKAKERLNWFSSKHSQKNKNTQARTVYNPTYDFTIDTDYLNYLEYGNYHSYTFPVIRDEENENLIENFVLSLQNDGTYSLNLYQYDLSPNNNGSLTNSDIIKVTQTIFPEDLDFTNQVLSRDSDPCRVDYWSGLGSNGWYKTQEECEEATGGEPCSITRTVENPNCNTLSDNGGGSGGSGSTTTIFFPDIPDSGNDLQGGGIVVGDNPFGGILGGFGTAKDGSNPDTSQDDNTSNDSAQDDENDCLQLDENGNCIGDITSAVFPDTDDECDAFDGQLESYIDSSLTSLSQSQLESIIDAPTSPFESASSYRNRIQAAGLYFNNLNSNGDFSPLKDALADIGNNDGLDLNDLGFIWDKLKETIDILRPHGLELATAGSLDNLDDILTVQELLTLDRNLITISALPSLKELFNDHWPQNAEEWSEFGEFIITVLKELVPELIPGVAEVIALKNSIEAFNSGNYTDGSTELAFAIVGFFPVGKAIKAIAKIAKGFKVVVKVTKSYRKAKQMTQAISGSLDDALPFWNSLGCKGNSKRVRELSNASEAQGKSFYDLLTKNGVDITPDNAPTGLIVKRMPDESKIKFRNFATSADDFGTNATIEFEGGNYLSHEIKELKFND